MGGLVIETIRPGVQFTPDAAAAFRRAEAQTQREVGRNIGVNSTWRSWSKQMSMHNAWNAYEAGRGPYPGHSKAVHPSESFHVDGTALDSDDWRNARIVQILAENGFIRNRLYVPNEEHHFEYIRARDANYGKSIKPKEIRVKPYNRKDKPSRNGGRTVAPGDTFKLDDTHGGGGKNIVGGVGPYAIVAHVYAEGTPGDSVELHLERFARGETPSKHYVERAVFDRNGLVRANPGFQLEVKKGDRVFVALTALSTNTDPVKVTLLDSDAYLFTVA